MPSIFKNPSKIYTPSGYAGNVYYGSIKIWPSGYAFPITTTPTPTLTPELLFTFSNEAIMTISGSYVYKM